MKQYLHGYAKNGFKVMQKVSTITKAALNKHFKDIPSAYIDENVQFEIFLIELYLK
ncbi:hypothetical protein [Runella sp.]|uniref:hypothetical protein n=1 Tax=Runella sp. TaxID=1960881 RepID=UPI003D139777